MAHISCKIPVRMGTRRAAELLNIHPATLSEYARQKRIETYRVGNGRYQFTEEGIGRFLEAARRPQAP